VVAKQFASWTLLQVGHLEPLHDTLVILGPLAAHQFASIVFLQFFGRTVLITSIEIWQAKRAFKYAKLLATMYEHQSHFYGC
jgi:hypothetical protein